MHVLTFSSRLGYSTGYFPALLSTCSRRKKGKKSAIQVDNAYLAGPASKAVQLYDRCRDEHMVARHEVEHDGVADAFVDGLDVPHLCRRTTVRIYFTPKNAARGVRAPWSPRAGRAGSTQETTRETLSATRNGGYVQRCHPGSCRGRGRRQPVGQL